MDSKDLERIKQQYKSTAPNVPLQLVAEIERLRAGSAFSCGCRFYACASGYCWDLCDTHNNAGRLKAAIEPVLEQAKLDEEISPERYNLASKRVYEIILTKEEVEALRELTR